MPINYTKTPNPKCRLYLCLIEFKDWRYSQSCLYFRPLLWTSEHQLRPEPADLYLFVGSWREYHMFMSDWSARMTPQNATLDSKRTLSWFVLYQRLSPQFQFSLSPAFSRYVSLWTSHPLPCVNKYCTGVCIYTVCNGGGMGSGCVESIYRSIQEHIRRNSSCILSTTFG